jgi:predicted phosphodiesterase
MVGFKKKIFPLTLFFTALALAALWGGCTVDGLGLAGSTDFSRRWRERNNFVFLSPADRNLSLGDDFSFIVLSDTHLDRGDAHGLERLKNVIDGEVKFVVITGDITQGGHRREVQQFIDIARSLGVPCYPVVGNHDVYFGNWQVWKELIGSTCYRIDGGGATLLMLDSANAYFGAEQISWLERELGRSTGRVFVFTHVNLFVQSLRNEQQFTDIRERARITSLLKGRCDIMFAGHVHKRIIREMGGVRYITTEDYRDHKTYCRVSVSKDGVRYEFKTL